MANENTPNKLSDVFRGYRNEVTLGRNGLIGNREKKKRCLYIKRI